MPIVSRKTEMRQRSALRAPLDERIPDRGGGRSRLDENSSTSNLIWYGKIEDSLSSTRLTAASYGNTPMAKRAPTAPCASRRRPASRPMSRDRRNARPPRNRGHLEKRSWTRCHYSAVRGEFANRDGPGTVVRNGEIIGSSVGP